MGQKGVSRKKVLGLGPAAERRVFGALFLLFLLLISSGRAAAGHPSLRLFVLARAEAFPGWDSLPGRPGSLLQGWRYDQGNGSHLSAPSPCPFSLSKRRKRVGVGDPTPTLCTS